MTGPLDLAALDPGVRALVAFLRNHGFETTDSGDGVSKPPGARALYVPHVFAVAPPARLVAEADRMARALEAAGVDLRPGELQATYDPVDGVGVIGLLDEGDRWVRAFGGGR